MQENGSKPTCRACRYHRFIREKDINERNRKQDSKNKYNKIYFYRYIAIFFLRHIIIANLSQDTAADLFHANCQKINIFQFNLF